MNKSTKRKYVQLVEFLGKALGRHYEIVLHDIAKDGSSVVAIANNHISLRDLDSPLTGFALELLRNKAYIDKDYLVDYKAVTKSGKSVNGSTFFIKENNKLEGMLCINHDNKDYLDISQKVLELGNILTDQEHKKSICDVPTDKEKKGKPEEITEYLSESLDDILNEVVESELLKSGMMLKPEKKQQIVQQLFDKGVFNIKGAVLKIADYLNMSEQSVYRYLRKVK